MFGLILYGNCLAHVSKPISWGIVAKCGVGWIVGGIGSTVDLWLAVVQLSTILIIAFGALFLAVHLINDGRRGKKLNTLFVVFIIFIFVGFPVWAWILPDDGTIAYNYWKIIGVILAGLFSLIIVAAIVQKYAAKRKGVNEFFQLASWFDSLSSWEKYGLVGALAFVGMFALNDPSTVIPTIYWWVTTILGYIVIRMLNKYSETKKPSDKPVNREQLLEALNDINVELKALTDAVKRM